MVHMLQSGIQTTHLNEADFYIKELFPINFFGQTVHITTTHVCTVIVILAIMILTLFLRHAFFKAEREGRMTTASTLVEMGVDALTRFVEDALGKDGAKKYINYIGVLFMYIFFCNTSGIFGLRPPTADFGTTLCLALITFVNGTWSRDFSNPFPCSSQ